MERAPSLRVLLIPALRLGSATLTNQRSATEINKRLSFGQPLFVILINQLIKRVFELDEVFKDDVGSGLSEVVVGEYAGVDGYGEDAGVLGCHDAERRVLHHHGVVRRHVQFLQPLEVALGIWLALLGVVGCDDVLRREGVRECRLQLLDGRFLARAGHYRSFHASVHQCGHHLLGSRHDWRFAQALENPAFLLVNLHFLFLRTSVSELPCVGGLHGLAAAAALVQIHVPLGEVQSDGVQRIDPCFGVERHAVEQHSVHIEKYGVNPKRRVFVRFHEALFYCSYVLHVYDVMLLPNDFLFSALSQVIIRQDEVVAAEKTSVG